MTVWKWAVMCGALAMAGSALAQQMGDTRCTASGKVERYSYAGWVWTNEVCDRKVVVQSVCQPGDEKCGPDGWVLKCEKRVSGEIEWVPAIRRCK